MLCVLYSMSTTIAGSWTNGNLNPNSPYWGLTRVIGPSDTARADVERNKSVPGKFYANASAWFTNMNPSIQNETLRVPRAKWVDQDNGVFLQSTSEFQAPIGYRIPRISPRGKGGKRVVGGKGTGNHTPKLGVSDNESAEVGSLGREGDVVQPARKQDRPNLTINTSMGRSPSDMFKPNSVKGSPVTPSAASSYMSLDSPNLYTSPAKFGL
jgi:hypothetical protein